MRCIEPLHAVSASHLTLFHLMDKADCKALTIEVSIEVALKGAEVEVTVTIAVESTAVQVAVGVAVGDAMVTVAIQF